MNRVAFIVTALLVSSPAWAAGGGDGGIPMTEIGIHAVNFVLMYGLLFVLLRKPVGELLRRRQGSIRQELEDASGAKNEAQARLDAVQSKLDDFDAELAQMVADAREDAAAEARYTAERTERDATMLREMTAGTVREETRNARAQLQQDVVDAAVKLAEEKLRADIGGADHDRLANDFLGALKGGAHA